MFRASTLKSVLPRIKFSSGGICRLYHSQDHLGSNDILNKNAVESIVFTKALEFVPEKGFTKDCVHEAVRELKYSDSLLSIFSNSSAGISLEFQLVLFWLKYQRQNLLKYVESNPSFFEIDSEENRVAHLIQKRLEFNEPVIGKLSGALSQLIIPYHFDKSLEELHNLSDDVAFYSNDQSNDFSWYSKRFGISTIYASSEVYMLQDNSPKFRSTHAFVEEKVKHLYRLGEAYNSFEEWTLFNAMSTINLIKSQWHRG